jgi:hypothetical protein
LMAVVGIAVLFSSAFGGGLAAAQTGYPPTTTASSALCAGGGANAGVVKIGATVTFTLCGPFRPGSAVALTVDGDVAGVKTANANGAVTVVITITSSTTALVNDPIKVDVNCGANNVIATGTSPTGTTVVSTGTFSITCAPTTSGGLAFTGANISKFLAAALLLIAVGVALLVAERRRRVRTL